MTRILVAEDVPDIRELISLALTHSGFEVICAADGVEAVEAANEYDEDFCSTITVRRRIGSSCRQGSRGGRVYNQAICPCGTDREGQGIVAIAGESGRFLSAIRPLPKVDLIQHERYEHRLKSRSL